jgi:hypothetical protein
MNMQLDIGTLVTIVVVIATQVGSTTALSLLYKQIVSRLDVQNGRVTMLEHEHQACSKDVQEDLRTHVEKFHVKK